MKVLYCSTINTNPETEIGVLPEGQKSKTTSHWLVPLPQPENKRFSLNFSPDAVLWLCLLYLCSSCLIILILALPHWKVRVMLKLISTEGEKQRLSM